MARRSAADFTHLHGWHEHQQYVVHARTIPVAVTLQRLVGKSELKNALKMLAKSDARSMLEALLRSNAPSPAPVLLLLLLLLLFLLLIQRKFAHSLTLVSRSSGRLIPEG